MKKWVANFVVNGIVFYGVNTISGGAIFEDYWAIIGASAILVLLNVFVKPIISALSIPLTCITFGLFRFVVSAVVISIVDLLMSSVHFQSFWQNILTAVLLAAAGAVIGDKKK